MRLPQRLVLLLALLLAGCEQVRFEQVPGGPYRACESVWVGDWSVIEPEADAESEALDLVLRVEADCAVFHSLVFKDGAWSREERLPDGDSFKIVFSSTSKHQILGFVASTSDADGEKRPSLAAVWTQQGDAIDIAWPDVRKSAQLLVDSTDYAGTVTRSVLRDVLRRDGLTYHMMNVEFSGTSEVLARLLDQEEILETPSLRLTRIPAEEQARLDPLLRAAIEAADRADAAE
ncbi:MAG: hypothetical protein MUE46_07275 [Xanthomonadales bacterium]|nr:hypothetical protein [Xanthomonadales bacterium]